ncbi:MAG: hypothetical protein HY842_10755 [Bacteroidetes bacterium]|nr:hypothetical protein [Bacteroidota bacterium]
MKIIKISLLLLTVLALAAACKKKPKPGYSTVKLDEVFELKMSQSVVVKDNDLKLTFMSVPSDSRCPKNVDCIREGEVKINISAAVDGRGQTLEFERAPSTQGNVTRAIGNFKIQLLDVSPYPESGKKIKPEDYVAKLAVRKAG